MSKDSPKISYNAQRKCKKLDVFFGEVKDESSHSVPSRSNVPNASEVGDAPSGTEKKE